MRQAIPQCSEHLQLPSGEVRRAGIQQRPVIRERDLIEQHLIVVLVVGSPAAVAALHGERPLRTPLHGDPLKIGLRRHDLRQRDHDRSRIIVVGVIFILELEVPAAGLRVRRGDDPVSDLVALAC